MRSSTSYKDEVLNYQICLQNKSNGWSLDLFRKQISQLITSSLYEVELFFSSTLREIKEVPYYVNDREIVVNDSRLTSITPVSLHSLNQ